MYCIKLLLLHPFFYYRTAIKLTKQHKYTHTHLFAQIKGYKLNEL